jgi:hypothetical protein
MRAQVLLLNGLHSATSWIIFYITGSVNSGLAVVGTATVHIKTSPETNSFTPNYLRCYYENNGYTLLKYIYEYGEPG